MQSGRICLICGGPYLGRNVCSDPTCRRNTGRRRHVLDNIHLPIGEPTATTGPIAAGSDDPPSTSPSSSEEWVPPRNLHEEIELIIDGLNQIIIAMQAIIRRHGVLALRRRGLEEPIIRLARTINLRVRR